MGIEWTVEKVIEEAAKLPGWFLSEAGFVRRQRVSGVRQCPVCAAVEVLWPEVNFTIEFLQAADVAGIPEDMATWIMCAADNMRFHDPVVRSAMLSAFHLQEEER